MTSFSQRISNLLAEINSNGNNKDELAISLLRLVNESRTDLELDLIEFVYKKLSQLTPSRRSTRKNKEQENKKVILERLLANKQLNIAFINDNGFYAGAGIALARQARSFALAGHKVSIIALNGYTESVASRHRYEEWLNESQNINPIYYTVANNGSLQKDRSGAIDHLDWIKKQKKLGNWDLIILGNLHSCNLSLNFLDYFLREQIPIIWFAHDLDLLGGGCAYPQYYNCNNHASGCIDSECPKPLTEYPTSSSGRIRQQYIQRSIVFNQCGVQLATHSNWSKVQLEQRFGTKEIIQAPLGIDINIFKPSQNQKSLRKKLGLKPDLFTIVFGADSIGRPGKGGEILNELLPVLLRNKNLQLICFGHYPESYPRLINCGHIDNEKEIADIYASGDIFLNPVTIEAFGQTLIEASACGCVPIALKGSGVESIIKHERSGILCENTAEIYPIIKKLYQNRELHKLMKKEAIETARQQFSLERQSNTWAKELLNKWGKSFDIPNTSNQRGISTNPKLSIITTTLNCADELIATATTLAMSEWQDFEWVVQDGGSTDLTYSVAKDRGVNLNWECSADQGIYDALNQAIKRSKGEWILVLQAGDWLAGPKALKDLFNSINESENDIIIANFNEISIEGKKLIRSPANPCKKLEDLKSGAFNKAGRHWLHLMPCHQAILIRRQWCLEFPFNLEMKISADWLQLFETIDAGAKVAMSDTILSWYPNGGYSFDNSQLWIENVIRIARYFQKDHLMVEQYFHGALLEHTSMTQKRKIHRLALERWYPSN